MRYIGNKTKLLSFIGGVLDKRGIRTGRALDAFSGTASVARFLKRRGMSVTSCDIMTYSMVLQKAYVEVDAVPDFLRVLTVDSEVRRLRETVGFQQYLDSHYDFQEDLFHDSASEYSGLRQVLAYLESFLPPLSSFVTAHYARAEDEGSQGRMFFTRRNALRIDAIRTRIHEWFGQGLLSKNEFYLLLAVLLEAADSVANTTGVYAAYVKSWQANALQPLRLRIPDLVVGTGLGCAAIQDDVTDVVGRLGKIDLLYLDPPYNTRQYSSYYHVPELLAKGWFGEDPEIRGKTGLIADADKKSPWSTRANCTVALSELVARVDCDHILMSYNSEGIIPESEIARIFQEWGSPSTFEIMEAQYGRYRSDRDSAQRQYKADVVTERIYCVSRDRAHAYQLAASSNYG